jgi:hypothetical protein
MIFREFTRSNIDRRSSDTKFLHILDQISPNSEKIMTTSREIGVDYWDYVKIYEIMLFFLALSAPSLKIMQTAKMQIDVIKHFLGYF